MSAPAAAATGRRGPEVTIALVAAFWGSIGLVVREIDLSAVAIVTFRVVIASVGVAVFLLARPDDHGRRVVVHAPGRTVLQGLMLAAHWVLFFAALQRAPVGLVVLFVYVAPVLVAALAPVLLHEPLTGRLVAAVGLGLAGTALLLGPGTDGVEVTGVVYAVLAAVLMAGLILNARSLSPSYGGLRLALAEVGIAAVVLVPVAVVQGGGWPDRSAWAWLLVLGLVHTALCLAVYLGAMRHVPAVHVSVLSYLEPLSAALLGWLVLDEALGLGTVLGGLLVVAGGLLVLGTPGGAATPPEAAGLSG